MQERTKVQEFIRAYYRWEEQEHRFLPAYEGYDWKQLSRMTHLEPFRYAVWNPEDIAACVDRAGCEDHADTSMRYVLFDYRDRSPLTREAGTQVIESCELSYERFKE